MLAVLGLQITTECISATQTLKSKQFCFKDQNYGILFHHLSLSPWSLRSFKRKLIDLLLEKETLTVC